MNPISPDAENRVLALKLQGLSNREIHEKTDVSLGSISNITKKLEEKYDQEPDAVIEFHRQLKKSGITPSDIIKGSIISARLEQLKIREEELDFLSTVYSKCKDERIPPEELANHLKFLIDVKSSSKIPIKELASYHKNLHNQCVEISKKVGDLKEQKSSVEKQLLIISQAKGKITKDMQEYYSVKKSLDSHHIILSDLEKLVTMLNQARENKYNIGEIGNYLKQERGIRGSVKQHTSRLGELEIEIKSKSKQHSDISNKLSLITKKYEHLSLVIKAIEDLFSKGLDPSAILHWNKILTSSGSTPESLIKDLDDYANLTETIKSKKENLDALKQEIAKLAPQVKALQLEKNSLEASISTMEQYFSKTIEQAKEKVENSINKISVKSQQEIISYSNTAKENLTMFSVESKKEMVQYAKDTQNQLNDISSTAKSEIESVKSEIINLVSELQNTSEEFGKMEAIIPLLKIISGRTITKAEICMSLDSLLQYIQNCKEIQNHTRLKNSLADLQRQVKLQIAISA